MICGANVRVWVWAIAAVAGMAVAACGGKDHKSGAEETGGARQGSGGNGGSDEAGGARATGGRPGTGGSSTGGSAGEESETGGRNTATGGGGSGGGRNATGGRTATGGRSTTGGSNGSGGARTGGQGGDGGDSTTTVCGDGVVEGVERCDGTDGLWEVETGELPPNCTQNCTVDICDECKQLNEPSQDLRGCFVFETENARLLCESVLQCALQEDCYRDAPQECYCGDVPTTECMLTDPLAPQGPCRDVIEAATPLVAEDEDLLPYMVAQTFFNTRTPVGLVAQMLSDEVEYCAESCGHEISSGQGGAGTGGAGTGGAPATGGAVVPRGGAAGEGGAVSGGRGGVLEGGTAGSVAAEYTTCEGCRETECPDELAAMETQCASGQCDEYVACVEDTKCSTDSETQQCFCGTATPGTQCTQEPLINGPCKSAAVHACGCDTREISSSGWWSQLDNPLGAVNRLYECSRAGCQSFCEVE